MKQTSVEKELVDIVNSVKPIDLLYPNKKDIPCVYNNFKYIMILFGGIGITLIASIYYLEVESKISAEVYSSAILISTFLLIAIAILLDNVKNRLLNKRLRSMGLPQLSMTKGLYQIDPLTAMLRQKIREKMTKRNLLNNINDVKRIDFYKQTILESIKTKQSIIPVSTFRIYLPILLVWFLGSILEPILEQTAHCINPNNVRSSVIFLIIAISLTIVCEATYRCFNVFQTKDIFKLNRTLQVLINIRMEMEREEIVKKRTDNHNQGNKDEL